MADSSSKPAEPSRRNFLKVGAGVVAGAAIASVVEIPYYSSVIGGNNSVSSSTVGSLNDELNATQSALSSTQSQLAQTQSALSNTQSSLAQAQGTISTLNSQISSQSAALNSANGQVSTLSSQLTSTQQALTSANSQVTSLQGQVTSANSQVTSLQSSLASAQSTIGQSTGFLALSPSEAVTVMAAAETMIPTDSNGPGANEAGVVYFIDRQLASDYGWNARMFMQAPFVPANITSPVTIDGITYSAGTPKFSWWTGQGYEYQLPLRDFWRYGLAFMDAYATSAYGGSFASLSATNQAQVLSDMSNNKPTNFTGPTATDFFNELYFMVWAGFMTDPLYGGNQGMVGWLLTGFTGTNTGNAYGEGYTSQQLMLSTKAIPLKPQSLAEMQAQQQVY